MSDGKRFDLAKTVLVLLLLVIGLLIAFFLLMPKPKPAAVAIPDKATPVLTLKIVPAPVQDIVYLPGRVEARTETTLSVEKPGVVTSIAVDKGDRVHPNQVLLTLDDRTWRLLTQQADIELRDATREWLRWQNLKDTGAVATSDYERIQTRYAMAATARSNAQLNVDKCELRSPIAGLIDDRFVEVGENVPDGARAFRIVDLDTVKLVVDIPEREIPYIATGCDLSFALDAYPGQTFTGAVVFVAAAAGRESNTFRAELKAANSTARLRPGMLARLALPRRQPDNAILLPLAAILPKKGDYVVFVVERGLASRRLVKIEAIRGSEAIIASGVGAGDEVIVEGNRTLADGMAVNVVRNSELDGKTP